ncbi:Deoxycytidine monophosphate (dCMP) deaminase [Mortierella sp. NVP85]|nr:Deoxycytidine monophosphate (dCMP) deaminase [Mortierella sp. NVP85]
MFVGIVGPTCSGKHEVMNLMASFYGFTRLYLRHPVTSNHDGSDIKSTRSNGQWILPNRQKVQPFLEFETISEILDHVTLHWMDHFVTCDVHAVDDIAILRKRPFFLLLSVESPIMIRFRRCVSRCHGLGLQAPTLEEFVEMTDVALYTTSASSIPSSTLRQFSTPSDEQEQDLGREQSHNGFLTPQQSQTPSPSPVPTLVSTLFSNSPPYKLLSMSDLSILNNFSDVGSLQRSLEALDITNPDLLRPSWDSYFMYLANLAARRSNCMKRRVGCVLVREKRVIATGYNGTPKNLRNCNEGGCPRCNQATPCGQGLDRCLCMHAEENALLEAGRERIGTGSIIYCNTCPCLGCAIKIVQVGVSQVVYSESYGMDDLTAEVFRKAGVELRQHATPSLKLE